MSRLTDFIALLNKNFDAEFRSQRSMPIFHSTHSIKGSVYRALRSHSSENYESVFYKVISNASLKTFDSRYRSLDLSTVGENYSIKKRVYTEGSYVETDVTNSSATTSSNVIIMFNCSEGAVFTFTSSEAQSSVYWNSLTLLTLVQGTNTITVPAPSGDASYLGSFDSPYPTLSNFVYSGYALAEPPFYVQILDERQLVDLYEYTFEVRYSLS